MKRGVVDGKRLEDVVEPQLHPSEVSQLRVQVRGSTFNTDISQCNQPSFLIAATIGMFDYRCEITQECRQ